MAIQLIMVKKEGTGAPPALGDLLWTLDNPNPYGTSASDNFGDRVAISGTYSIVGAHQEDDAGGSDSGKSYIFNNSTGALLHTLDNPNPHGGAAADYFGEAVSISDNYAVVGAYRESDANGVLSGKAYVYNPSTGALLWTLDNPNPTGTSQFDQFGFSVGASDSYIIGGAPNEDVGGSNAGRAYIFNASTGALLHQLANPTPADDNFGSAVAISDTHAIVGSYNAADGGKAYIFSTTTGALLHTLDNPNAYDTAADDWFGGSVAISDSYVIVGAYQEDDASGGSSGKAYVFSNATGALLHTVDNPNAYGTSAVDQFANVNRVGITDTYFIVSTSREDDATGGFDVGKAYIFNTVTGALVKTVDNPNAYGTSNADQFGTAAGISGSYAIVGAPGEDDAGGNSSGKAYIFNI